jgi:hypothetical protein
VIVLDASVYANFAAVQAHAAQVGANVVITLNATTSLTLDNVQLNQLSAGNFVFFAAGASEPVDKAQVPLTSAIEHGTDAALTSPLEHGSKGGELTSPPEPSTTDGLTSPLEHSGKPDLASAWTLPNSHEQLTTPFGDNPLGNGFFGSFDDNRHGMHGDWM